MATAQVLKATHAVDDKVVRVENKVDGIDEGVDRVNERVICGKQPSLISQQGNTQSILMCLEGKETRLAIQKVADDMDQVKSLSFSFCVDISEQAKASQQGINYDRTFANGSLRQIPLRTTTLPAPPIASKKQSGFSKEVLSPNGNPMVHFSGCTGNVRSLDLSRADTR